MYHAGCIKDGSCRRRRYTIDKGDSSFAEVLLPALILLFVMACFVASAVACKNGRSWVRGSCMVNEFGLSFTKNPVISIISPSGSMERDRPVAQHACMHVDII